MVYLVNDFTNKMVRLGLLAFYLSYEPGKDDILN